MRLRTEALFYLLAFLMWSPAFLSVFLGPKGWVFPNANCTPLNCFGNYWDRYEADFIVIDLLAFAPLSMVIINFAKRVSTPWAFFFAVSGMWWLILAIPDWLIGDITARFSQVWFVESSSVVLMVNFTLWWTMRRQR
jgi:hypothetical protein